MIPRNAGRNAALGAAGAVLAAGPALAEHALGDRELALKWRARVSELIAEEGVAAASARLNAAGSRFRQARPHLAILRLKDGQVVAEAHTRFPELAGAEITQLQDLKRRKFIQDFVEALKAGGGPVPVANAIPETDGKIHPALCSVTWRRATKARISSLPVTISTKARRRNGSATKRLVGPKRISLKAATMRRVNPVPAGVLCLILATACQPAAAEHALGGRATALAWRDKLQQLIAEQGIQAAIAALQNPDSRFHAARPALTLQRVENGKVFSAAHTLFPELAGAEITRLRDLNERPFIRQFLKAVRAGGGTLPTDNAIPQTDNTIHHALCRVEWARGYRGQYFIAVCYDRHGNAPRRPD